MNPSAAGLSSGLMVAGVAALFLGKDLFSWLGRWVGSRGGSQGTAGFRINSVAPRLPFAEDTWRLTVDGLFRKPLALTFAQFKDLPQVERTQDFYCVEGWGVSGCRLEGARPCGTCWSRPTSIPRATHLVFHSGDSAQYTDSLTLEEALQSDTLLAHGLNGEPLPPRWAARCG